jgi:uncharacterized membrane protein YgdD (TMEM256/DUF423 family)
VDLPRFFVVAGALLGAAGVALGAFGAHGLRTHLAPAALDTWQTAVSYQMWHALALLGVGILGYVTQASAHFSGVALAVAGFALLAGVLLFSCALYVLALGGPRWLGAVAPFGGTAFIVAWLALAWAALRIAPAA